MNVFLINLQFAPHLLLPSPVPHHLPSYADLSSMIPVFYKEDLINLLLLFINIIHP